MITASEALELVRARKETYCLSDDPIEQDLVRHINKGWLCMNLQPYFKKESLCHIPNIIDMFVRNGYKVDKYGVAYWMYDF